MNGYIQWWKQSISRCGWKYTVIFYISVVCKYPTCQVHADKLSSPVQTAFCWVILLTKLLQSYI